MRADANHSRLAAKAAAMLWLVCLSAACATATMPDEPRAFCPAAASQIDAAVAEGMAQGAPGIVVQVARAGEVVFARAYGTANLEHNAPMTDETVFRLASITKQFTAAAVLLLVEDGLIDLDDRLSQYVPELPQARDVTLYQLLVQTSGIPDYAEDPEGMRTRAVAHTTEEMIAWIARLEPRLQFEPGTRWAYSNSNYALLGAVVERVSGLTLQQFAERRLFAPAGLTATRFDAPSDIVAHRAAGYRRDREAPSGFANADAISWTIPGAAGGLRTTAGDLLRWTDALFGGRVISEQSLQRMIAPGLLSDGRTTKFGMPEAWQLGLNSDYGMGVFISQSDAGRRIWHKGDIDGFSTWLAHYPEHDVTIAVLQNSQSADIRSAAIEQAVEFAVLHDCRPSPRAAQNAG